MRIYNYENIEVGVSSIFSRSDTGLQISILRLFYHLIRTCRAVIWNSFVRTCSLKVIFETFLSIHLYLDYLFVCIATHGLLGTVTISVSSRRKESSHPSCLSMWCGEPQIRNMEDCPYSYMSRNFLKSKSLRKQRISSQSFNKYQSKKMKVVTRVIIFAKHG